MAKENQVNNSNNEVSINKGACSLVAGDLDATTVRNEGANTNDSINKGLQPLVAGKVVTIDTVKAYHITWVTHNSRISERMMAYKVTPKTDGVWLTDEMESVITQTIAEIIKEDNLNCLAYNICGDHIHILLVCEEEKLSKIVQKMKSKSARAVNIAMGWTISSTKESNQTGATREQIQTTGATREHAPLLKRGVTQTHLWAQKYSHTFINDEEQLLNTMNYIQNNRLKHQLPPINKGLQPLVNEMLMTIPNAFNPNSTNSRH